MRIDTVYAKWKIIFDENINCLRLYHKNSFENGKPSLIPHYHLQNVSAESIEEFLNYIVKHDEYRHNNPLHIKQGKPKKPIKGTSAWAKQQKNNKKKQKRKAVYNVLNIIENLHNNASA